MNTFYDGKIVAVTLLVCCLLLKTTSLLLASTTVHEQPQFLHGMVWMDWDGDGIHDEQESMAVGQTVFVAPDIESDFAQTLVLTTDINGEFSTGHLAPGNYRLWVQPQTIDEAIVITVADERTAMIVHIPLAAYTLYLPHIAH